MGDQQSRCRAANEVDQVKAWGGRAGAEIGDRNDIIRPDRGAMPLQGGEGAIAQARSILEAQLSAEAQAPLTSTRSIDPRRSVVSCAVLKGSPPLPPSPVPKYKFPSGPKISLPPL